jgi:phenylpropionate dioxygenase-like ring-hydroxylating dioxygenase large terminal subunit
MTASVDPATRLAGETLPVQQAHPLDYGVADIRLERYTSREFFELEIEKVWKRVWQLACFEDDIPNVGDWIRYDIVGISTIVVRSAPDKISAFYNACRHRAAALCLDPCGSAADGFYCPYHGWGYDLDGRVTSIPARWDFPQLEGNSDLRIPAIQVDTWDGFVFINLDPNARPLVEHLGAMPEHFARWPFASRWRAGWVAKIQPVNWKAAQEAFMEAYHLPATHPQALPSDPKPNDQVKLALLPQVALDAIDEMRASREARDRLSPASKVYAETHLDVLSENASRLAFERDGNFDTGVIYFLFPNMHPWGDFDPGWCYRFRPNGTDPQTSIMEVFCFLPVAPGTEPPPPAQLRWLKADQPWSDAVDSLGPTSFFLNQDEESLIRQQIGFHSTPLTGLSFSKQQESNPRFLHRRIDDFIAQK